MHYAAGTAIFLFFVHLARCQRLKCTKNESMHAKTTQTFIRQALGVFLATDAQGPARLAARGQIEN